MSRRLTRIAKRWSSAFTGSEKKELIALDLESDVGIMVVVPCASCGREFTHTFPRGEDGYLRDAPAQITCHRCNKRDVRFCTCDKCVRQRETCPRCGLKHENHEASWKCEACGAVLCASQIALVGGFSERCVHVVFPQKGSPVIEVGTATERTRHAYSICGEVVEVESLALVPRRICPDCGMYDGQECEKHGHWGKTIKSA